MPTVGTSSANYRLRVSAGPSYDLKTHKVVPVNAEETLRIENEQAVIYLLVRVQDYNGKPALNKRRIHPN